MSRLARTIRRRRPRHARRHPGDVAAVILAMALTAGWLLWAIAILSPAAAR